MQSEKMKKIGKRVVLIIAITCGLAILGFCGVFLFAALSRYGSNKAMNEIKIYSYLISGRGCNDMANASDEELKEYVKSDILSRLSEKKFRKILIREKEGYEEGRYDKTDSCHVMVKRVIKIMDSF